MQLMTRVTSFVVWPALLSLAALGCDGQRSAKPDQCVGSPGGSPAEFSKLNPSAVTNWTAAAPSAGCQMMTAYSLSRPLGYYKGDPLPDHIAYLTFDDGPCDWTTDVLDILKDKGVHASFFVNSRNIDKALGLDGPQVDSHGNTSHLYDVLKREQDEGHVIGNHTVHHADLSTLPESAIVSEIDDNEESVNNALIKAGRAPQALTLLRPPYSKPWEYPAPQPANYNDLIAQTGTVFERRGLNIFFNLDSSDSLDWAQGEAPARHPATLPVFTATAPTWDAKVARIRQTVLTSAKVLAGTGVVIIMHDIHPTTRDALPAIIDGLRALGYSFGTMEDYAQWRWSRHSAEMTPGPGLYNACTRESDWGCQSFGAAGDPAAEVCGRLWLGYQALDGVHNLGQPRGAPARATETGIVSQPFERGVLKLYPQNTAACQVGIARLQ
jgi:peptidoglycan/xylan/chitin deacetylase (PgdA/CDA1 family)